MPSSTRSSLALIGLLLAGCAGDVAPVLDAGLDASERPDAPTADAAPDAGGCIQASLEPFRLDVADDVSIRYRASIQPAIGGNPYDLYLEMNRYGDATYEGTFTLGEGPDANFGTCAHCVVAFTGTGLSRGFMADSGTLELRRDPFSLRLDAVLDGLRMIEITIEGEDLHSVPVPGGRCLVFDRVEVDRAFAPPGWTCNAEQYGDGETCNCRCGISDADCFEGSLPVAGCLPDQLCIARIDGFELRPACADPCDRDTGVSCPPRGVCVDDFVGGVCDDSDVRIDRDALVGERCSEGARHCAVALAPDGSGVANGYCDDTDPSNVVCRPRCEQDDECDAARFERCYTIGFSRDDTPYGFCAPRFPPSWTCSGARYEDGVTCDCECGAPDPDCTDPTRPLMGCDAAERCLSDAMCAPIPANDTCATATALGVGTTTGTTRGGGDDYTHVRDGGGCIAVDEDGPDVVYSIALTAGQRLRVVGSTSEFDIALSLLGPGSPAVCDRASSACVAGTDSARFGEPETLDHVAAATGTYYLVVDSFYIEQLGAFELVTSIE